MQKLRACRNRPSEIQRRRSTNSWCMIDICPAGPPKLMKPSFSQNQNASRKLISAGLGRSSSTADAKTLLIGFFLFRKPGEQAVEDGARSGQQKVVMGNGFTQPGQHPFDARRLDRLNTADVEVMHQGGHAVQARLLDVKTGLQGFEGHAVADVTESCIIEIKTQRVGGTVLWAVQPEDLSGGINEPADQPSAGQAVNPGTLTGCPDTALIVAKAEGRYWQVSAMGFVRRQGPADRRLKFLQGRVDLLFRLAWKVVDAGQLFVAFAQLANLLRAGERILGR